MEILKNSQNVVKIGNIKCFGKFQNDSLEIFEKNQREILKALMNLKKLAEYFSKYFLDFFLRLIKILGTIFLKTCGKFIDVR